MKFLFIKIIILILINLICDRKLYTYFPEVINSDINYSNKNGNNNNDNYLLNKYNTHNRNIITRLNNYSAKQDALNDKFMQHIESNIEQKISKNYNLKEEHDHLKDKIKHIIAIERMILKKYRINRRDYYNLKRIETKYNNLLNKYKSSFSHKLETIDKSIIKDHQEIKDLLLKIKFKIN